MPPEHLKPPDHQPRRAEHDPERDAHDLHPRRYPRELSLDEVDVVFDRGEVGAREVDLAHGVWHDARCDRGWFIGR